jgi:hypothetical protein
MVVLDQSKGKILPAPRAGLINTGSKPPKTLESRLGFAAKVKDPVRRQRAEDQEDLVMRLMRAESQLNIRYSGEKLEYHSKRYLEAAELMIECSNMAVPYGDIGVKGGENNARHFSGLRHCGKPICPNCLPYQDAKRRERLDAVALEIAKLPLNHFIVTITLRHHYSPNGNWKTLVKAIKKTWRKMIKERRFRESLEKAGIEGGYFWKMETTFSYQWGHHPHLHVLLSLPNTVNALEFKQWVKEYWERRLKEEGRTCEWKDGWFESLRTSTDVRKIVSYLNGGIKEVTGNATKKLSPWKLEPEAFVEIFYSMKNEKWFGSGKCWKKTAIVEAESESKLEQERESKEPFIYVIKREWWNALNFNQRFDVRKIVGDRSFTHEQCVDNLNEFFMEFIE